MSFHCKVIVVFVVNNGINDYAKDSGPGVVWLLCSFYREPLSYSIVKEVQHNFVS